MALSASQDKPRKLLDAMKKYWEIIADRLGADGWSWGMTTEIDPRAGRVFLVDAHRSHSAGRFIVRSDEHLTAFFQLRPAAVPHGD